MNFELLPNELFIECFEYLDIFDIFCSFGGLNYRFTKLLLNLSLHLKFEHVSRKFFFLFHQNILPIAKVRQKIYSLNLSNKGTCDQINTFFSFTGFSHLHSLTLTHVEKEDIPKLKSLLPLLSELYSFHLISPQIDDEEIVSALPLSNLRKLSLPTLRSFLKYIQQPTLITHLMISNCSLEQLLYQLFEYVPLIKYLKIEFVSKYNRPIKNQTNINAVHLEQLIIDRFQYPFVDFANFIKQTPNLQSLTISTDGVLGMIYANQWKHLITSSLPDLKIFKFKFCVHIKFLAIVAFNFKQFHKRFWIKQHQWSTQLLIDKKLYIYTIPYLSNTLKLESHRPQFSKNLTAISNVFGKVTDLTLNRKRMIDECRCYFSNINSLKLAISEEETDFDLTPIQYVECLKMIMNLSNLKHLDISTYKSMISAGELLEILKQSPQLSSITIDPNDLILFFNDKQLCKYLNKMITKLDVYKHEQFLLDNLDVLKKFCKIFSNLEQLRCNINQPKHILFLLYRLMKVSKIYVYLSSIPNRNSFQSLFEKSLPKLKATVRMTGVKTNGPELSIWMDKNMK